MNFQHPAALFEQGVDVTLGLPIVRTSPDHGTALNIAGKGRANPASLIAALDMAADIARRRAARGLGATQVLRQEIPAA